MPKLHVQDGAAAADRKRPQSWSGAASPAVKRITVSEFFQPWRSSAPLSRSELGLPPRRHSPFRVREDIAPANYVRIDVTSPVQCRPLNVTFDPRKGTPPYNIMISAEQWYPQTYQLPATYADPDAPLWLFEWDVPSFQVPNIGVTTTPNIVVSITDSTGSMSNSSVFQVASAPPNSESCEVQQGMSDFVFYSSDTPSQCQRFDVTYTGNWVSPVELYFLPNGAPPIAVNADNAVVRGNTSTVEWPMALVAGTQFIMAMSDAGPAGTGGVTGVNLVGGTERSSSDCLNSTALDNSIMRPTATITTPQPEFTLKPTSTDAYGRPIITTIINYRGSKNGPGVADLADGAIAGISVGAALLFLLVVVVLWWAWRHRRKHSATTAWDVPPGSVVDPNAPTDPRFLRKGRNRSNGGRADTDVEMETRADSGSSSSVSGGYGDRGVATSNSTQHSYPGTSSPTYDASMQDSQSVLARPPRVGQPLSIRTTDVERRTAAGGYESVPLDDESSSQLPSRRQGGAHYTGSGSTPNTPANVRSPVLPTGNHFASIDSPSSLQSPRRQPGSAHPTILQHSDAGLLLDDRLEDDAAGQEDFVELPPQYDTLSNIARDRLVEAARQAADRQNASSASPGEALREGAAGSENAPTALTSTRATAPPPLSLVIPPGRSLAGAPSTSSSARQPKVPPRRSEGLSATLRNDSGASGETGLEPASGDVEEAGEEEDETVFWNTLPSPADASRRREDGTFIEDATSPPASAVETSDSRSLTRSLSRRGRWIQQGGEGTPTEEAIMEESTMERTT